ncbi:MAG: chorismate synthase [Muribaculaceae bacterium]|nr:chorismate synthase [Muribaculaceae bacterium]
MNSWGKYITLTTFGESHGPAIGGIIDGLPAGLEVDEDLLKELMRRRRPGGTQLGTARNEADRVELLSGIFERKTTGTPIGFIIRNTDVRSADYEKLRDVYRPGHADFTYEARYGVRDYRGGGRASARETACRVVAGAFAMMLLRTAGVTVSARIDQVGKERCQERFNEVIQAARAEMDSVGGFISCRIDNVPAGWGAPLGDKLQSRLAAAIMSIPAAKGWEYGMGFEGCTLRGSEVADEFYTEDGEVRTRTNYSGGIQGGISNGNSIEFRVAFKPVASIACVQRTVNTSGEECMVSITGRHDPCVLPRAVVVVEAVAAMMMADAMLEARLARV